jgi:hypothetical protein
MNALTLRVPRTRIEGSDAVTSRTNVWRRRLIFANITAAIPSSRILREPFVHFMTIGTLLFLASLAFDRSSGQRRISVGVQDVNRIAQSYELQFGRPPTKAELNTLLDHYIDEEVMYREGLARGLDRGDEIVRRRIVQKFQFLQEDLAVMREPTEEVLRSFYQRYSERYIEPARVSFTHIFFSPDLDDDERSRARAVHRLTQLSAAPGSSAARTGDQFSGPSDYWSLDQPSVTRLFGESEISQRLFGLRFQEWLGPFRSGYGWHLVYLSAAEAPHLSPFEAVADRVRADYLDHQKQETNNRAFSKLKQKYVISRADVR